VRFKRSPAHPCIRRRVEPDRGCARAGPPYLERFVKVYSVARRSCCVQERKTRQLQRQPHTRIASSPLELLSLSPSAKRGASDRFHYALNRAKRPRSAELASPAVPHTTSRHYSPIQPNRAALMDARSTPPGTACEPGPSPPPVAQPLPRREWDRQAAAAISANGAELHVDLCGVSRSRCLQVSQTKSLDP